MPLIRNTIHKYFILSNSPVIPALLMFFLFLFNPAFSQKKKQDDHDRITDSLKMRINYLQDQLPKLQQTRSLNLFNMKRELDQSMFLLKYIEFVQDERLDEAKDLVLQNLEKAEFRKDENSGDFYKRFEKEINSEIKNQKIYYQKLFEKERTYAKKMNNYLQEKTPESVEKAKRINDLAIRYAKENQLNNTLIYLEKYRNIIDAFQFDTNSPFDLELLTNNENTFNKEFAKLISDDSIQVIEKADLLVDHCLKYSRTVTSTLDTTFFLKKKKYVANAIADYYDKEGAKIMMQNMTDQAVLARLDTINPTGVFKWHDKIIVINEFIPEYGSPNLKKGEAIIASDKKLIKYIKDQDVIHVKSNYDIGGTYFIPFKNNNGLPEEFRYNYDTKKWQYMLCYSVIENDYLTREVSKYMPPIVFIEEDMGQK